MFVKRFLVLCAHTLFVQAITAQSIGAIDSCGYTASWGPAPVATATCSWGTSSGPLEWSYSPASTLAASNGPGLATSSTSPTIPAGVSVISENAYEGTLAADGAIPFLGTVAIEGTLPTAGFGAIAYGCGNAVSITTEDVGAYGFTGMAGLSSKAGTTPVVYGSGIGYGPCGYATMF